MANLEQLGAISFTKGCYPGQEIVARAQYRGEVKRRLFRLHAPDAAPAAGQTVFEPGESAGCGMVVNAAPAPGGGFDLLAVLSTTAAEAGDLRLGGPDGPALRVCR
jgi:folate-binding Fe-S cluster repair protein YgfZ